MTKSKTTIAAELNDNYKHGIVMSKDEIKHFYCLTEHEYEDILVLVGNPQAHNTLLKSKHTAIYVWPGCAVAGQAELFGREMFNKFTIRAQYLEEVKVKLNPKSYSFRYDTFFAVHQDDATKFESRRVDLKILSLEEAALSTVYPARIKSYQQ